MCAQEAGEAQDPAVARRLGDVTRELIHTASPRRVGV